LGTTALGNKEQQAVEEQGSLSKTMFIVVVGFGCAMEA